GHSQRGDWSVSSSSDCNLRLTRANHCCSNGDCIQPGRASRRNCRCVCARSNSISNYVRSRLWLRGAEGSRADAAWTMSIDLMKDALNYIQCARAHTDYHGNRPVPVWQVLKLQSSV